MGASSAAGLLWLAATLLAVARLGLLRGVLVAVWGLSVPAVLVMIALAARPERPSRRLPTSDGSVTAVHVAA